MLLVDLKSSDEEIAEQISTHCSQFGNVKSITIHRSPKHFALVEMETNDQTLKLAAYYRRAAFGSAVLIYLVQKGRRRS